jgi:hypothetical protein
MMRGAASGNKPARTGERHDVSESEICVANINAAGRRRRMTLGGVVIAATVAAIVLIGRMGGGVGSLIELPPLFFGWLCVMQATENT